VLPVLFEGQVKAVIELASFQRFGPTHQAFLGQLTESIGIVLNTIETNMRTEELLKQSQSLAGELQQRQEELQHTNNELEEKARLLAEQNREVERKNREVEQAKQELEEKAAQLALTSKYKSEFLANMSHELRTPLNSLLILAQQLSENLEGNLTGKQIEFAHTIYSSGSDLLTLINDILDLAKIESGTVTVDVDEMDFGDLRDYVERTFRPVAEAKGLDFTIELSRDLPKSMHTDLMRVQQVLKNLLSNAFKFTPAGKVSLRVAQSSAGWSADHETLNHARSVIAFSVSDTGIGIAPDKQRLIFEAFQQADGTTSRKYGGTGLGLSISREIARLLGGEIRLESVVGEGSEFTLYLPQPPVYMALEAMRQATAREGARSLLNAAPMISATLPRSLAAPSDEVGDDREDIADGDRVMLIVENDANFARVLLEKARDKGYKGVVALRGAAALGLARRYKPDAVTLDLLLGDVDGWAVLDLLKNDPEIRHIPVHIISVQEDRERARREGALSYLTKPVSNEELNTTLSNAEQFVRRPIKTLLIVEGDGERRTRFVEMVKGDGIECRAVGNAQEAREALAEQSFDCMVIDLDVPDVAGTQLIGELSKQRDLRELPIIVYTQKELTRRAETALKRAAKTLIVKSASSPERVLDEIALFLHRSTASLSEAQQQIVMQLHPIDAAFAGRRVLVVDDDVRNLFAITSLLERHSVEVLHAENGKDAIALLEKLPDIDVVLMDIMMPEMDGYDTMRAIRKNRRFRSLPIIALTAKAMKGDREKCIEAGASDYIPKPVASDQLLSLLQVWLHEGGSLSDGARLSA
jgi:signal transduction histidine kinase/DNA-binding response OmpR family regulator